MIRPRTSAALDRRVPVLVAAALGLLVPVAAGAAGPAQDEEQRGKQLEVLEELLSENVHEHVQERVVAEIRDNGADDEIAERGSLTVRVGSISRAHGVFIDGYGVIFSIQVPQVGVLPQQLFERLRVAPSPRWQARVEAPSEDAVQRVTARMVEGRARSMEQQLRALEALLRRQLESSGPDDTVERQLAQIQELRERFDGLHSEIEVEVGPEPGAPDAEPEAPEAEEPEAAPETPERFAAPEPEELTIFHRGGVVGEQMHMAKLLEESRERTAHAVAEATVETLADFGSILKGLDASDRISVVIVPSPSFLGEHGPDRGREEFVVSVRYGDIEALDDGDIDATEFRARVQVHNRLGTALDLSSGQQ